MCFDHGATDNAEWVEAHGNDTAILNMPSQISQQEKITQLIVVAPTDYQKPGVWEGLIPGFEKVKNQVERVQKDLGRHFEVMLYKELKQRSRRVAQDSVMGEKDEMHMDMDNFASLRITAA